MAVASLIHRSVPDLRARRQVGVGECIHPRSTMATHSDDKCRRCSCRRKACLRRRLQQRRHAKCLFPHAQFLRNPRAGSFFQCRRRQHPAVVHKELVETEWDDEIAIDSEDLKTMRDSVDAMQQQLRRGLRDIKEIRELVKRVATQREVEWRELSMRSVNMESISL